MGGDASAAMYLASVCDVSIHAPAWGATWISLRNHQLLKFQSTPPHGGRRPCTSCKPPWCLFQSTPPHGGRHREAETSDPWDVFQSTPPHGGRPEICLSPYFCLSFNPRPRMGGDTIATLSMNQDNVFQSTPPHGGRLERRPHEDRALDVSIHAPAWGATKQYQIIDILIVNLPFLRTDMI